MTKPLMLNVALLGMNDKNISTFTYFIKKHASKHLQIAVAEKADVFLIDFDTEAGIRQWHEYCGKTGKASIVMSAVDPAKNQSIWVKKPVTAIHLETAIGQLVKLANTSTLVHGSAIRTGGGIKVEALAESAQMKEPLKIEEGKNEPRKDNHLHVVADNTARQEPLEKPGYKKNFSDENSPNLTLSKDEIIECCGSQTDVDEADRNFRTRVSYDDSKTLLQPLRKAIALARDKNCVVEISGLHAQLVILPGGERAVVDFANRSIRHICAMPMQAMPEIRPMLMSAMQCERMYPAHHKNMHGVETVLWQVALWTSRGRLPKNIDPAQKMHLEYWPNFTRLQITPHAIHIASVWVENSMSPLEVSNTLHLPQRYVFSMAAAAQAVGAFVVGEGAPHKTVESSWKKPHEFFNTILRSLKMA